MLRRIQKEYHYQVVVGCHKMNRTEINKKCRIHLENLYSERDKVLVYIAKETFKCGPSKEKDFRRMNRRAGKLPT